MAYDPSEMVGTKRTDIRGVGDDLHSICTSHVEKRFNLGFSKKAGKPIVAAVAMFLAYYNYVWRTRLPSMIPIRSSLGS
jgi:hypothetical protein